MLKGFTYTDVLLGYRIDIQPLDPQAQWPTWCWQVTRLSNSTVVAFGEYRQKVTALELAIDAMNQHAKSLKVVK